MRLPSGCGRWLVPTGSLTVHPPTPTYLRPSLPHSAAPLSPSLPSPRAGATNTNSQSGQGKGAGGEGPKQNTTTLERFGFPRANPSRSVRPPPSPPLSPPRGRRAGGKENPPPLSTEERGLLLPRVGDAAALCVLQHPLPPAPRVRGVDAGLLTKPVPAASGAFHSHLLQPR